MNHVIDDINSQPRAVRIASAKKFLLKNSEKTKACAARIFNLSMKTKKKVMRQRERTAMNASTEDEKDEKDETDESDAI